MGKASSSRRRGRSLPTQRKEGEAYHRGWLRCGFIWTLNRGGYGATIPLATDDISPERNDGFPLGFVTISGVLSCSDSMPSGKLSNVGREEEASPGGKLALVFHLGERGDAGIMPA